MANTADQTYVRFRMQTEPDARASKDAGRPIFKDFEVCEIRFAGDRLKTGVFPAHEADPNATRLAGTGEFTQFMQGTVVTYAMRYNDQYKAFKNNEAQPVSGTPLSELPFLTEGKRRELKALNIHTAESLAGLDGQPLRQIGMGGRELKNQAQAYLDKAAGSSDVTRLAADNAALNDTVAEMRKQIAELTESVKSQSKPGGKRANATSPFASWEAEDLKNWIAEQSGSRPKGNPSHATLVASADEINAAIAKKSDAA